MVPKAKALAEYPLVKLARKANQMQTDGRLLSNRASLEIVRRRIATLQERINLNEAPDRLARIQRLWGQFKIDRKAKDDINVTIDIAAIDEEFEAAFTDYAAWRQMFEALDLDRKLVDSEVKVLKEIQAVLTAEDATLLAAKLLGATINTVNYMDIPTETRVMFIRRIQYEFTKLIGDRPAPGPGTGGEEDDDPGSDNLDGEGIFDPGNKEQPETAGEVATSTIPEGRVEGSPDPGLAGQL
jgi:hypothetical protein